MQCRSRAIINTTLFSVCPLCRKLYCTEENVREIIQFVMPKLGYIARCPVVLYNLVVKPK